MDAPTEVPEGMLSHTMTVINVVALWIFFIYQIIIKWFDLKSKREDNEKLDALVLGINTFLEAVKMQYATTNEFQEEMKSTMSGVRKLLTEMAQKNAGLMNRDNSLRVIEQSFANVIRDIVLIFAASLENNGFDERQEFIRNRVKTTIGQTLDNLRVSLGMFQMSVDIRPFFRSQSADDQGDRYVLVTSLWDLVEPLYRAKTPLKERLEEMRLIVPNRIRDYVAATKHTIVREDESGLRVATKS